MLSLEPCRCSSDLFLSSSRPRTGCWQPRILLGMVEARSVDDVKSTHTCGTRQLRSQGPLPVHAHRTEGATRSEGRKRANGGGIGVRGGIGDGNGGGNGDGNGGGNVNGDRDGAGTGTGVETRGRTRGNGNGDERGDGDESSSGYGNGDEDRNGNEDGIGESGREAKKPKKPHKRVVNALWETGETWVCVVCVCFFFPFILEVKFVGCTSRGHIGGRSHIISHPPSFCGVCLYFSREKDSAVPFPRRP